MKYLAPLCLLVTATLASASTISVKRDANPQSGLIVAPQPGNTFKTCEGLMNITITDIPEDVAVSTIQLLTEEKVPRTVEFGGLFFPNDRMISERVGIPSDGNNMTNTWLISVNHVTYDCGSKSSSTTPGPNAEIHIIDEGYDSSNCP